MNVTQTKYNLLGRGVHWLMAAMILAMLFIGSGMVTSLRLRPQLISWHVPLGFAILLLVMLRLANRFVQHAPKLPDSLPRWQVAAARASHWILYGLMLVMPVLGWATLSAAGFPIVPVAGLHLPPILPVDPTWYAFVRTAHGLLAWALFGTVLVHLAAGLLHAWVIKDGVFDHIGLWQNARSSRSAEAAATLLAGEIQYPRGESDEAMDAFNRL